MKTDKDKELDDLFRKGLGEPPHEAAYREGDWDALEQMMDNSKKRGGGIIFWLPILSAAAVLLIVMGWWLFKPATTPGHEKQQTEIAKQNAHDTLIQNTKTGQVAATPNTGNTALSKTGTTHSSNTPTVEHHTANAPVQPIVPQNFANNKKDLGSGDARKDLGSGDDKKDLGSGDINQKHNTVIANNNNNPVQHNNPANTTNLPVTAKHDSAMVAAINSTVNTQTAPVKDRVVDSIEKAGRAEMLAENKKKATKQFVNRPQYTLSFLGAPEINGANSLRHGQSGSNVGVLFSVGLKRFTFSSGAMYAYKPYGTGADGYKGSVQGISAVNADCRVLDIPLNVDFQLYNKHMNKFSIGSGLSSYIMLHERYEYSYADASIAPYYYTVPNTNKYFLSILNLQATYTRQVSSKVGISLQPYLKLPLSGIGASNARLQTTGLAVGLSWNLNSSSTP